MTALPSSVVVPARLTLALEGTNQVMSPLKTMPCPRASLRLTQGWYKSGRWPFAKRFGPVHDLMPMPAYGLLGDSQLHGDLVLLKFFGFQVEDSLVEWAKMLA